MSRYEDDYDEVFPRIHLGCQCGYEFEGEEFMAPDVCPQCGLRLMGSDSESMISTLTTGSGWYIDDWGAFLLKAFLVVAVGSVFVYIFNASFGDPIGHWWRQNWYFVVGAILFLGALFCGYDSENSRHGHIVKIKVNLYSFKD